MAKKKTQLQHVFSEKNVKYYGLAASLIAAFVAGTLVIRDLATPHPPSQSPASTTVVTPPAPTFKATGAATSLSVAANGSIGLPELGLVLKPITSELAQDNLGIVPGKDPSFPSKSLSFFSPQLASSKSACIDNGVRGWIGTLTRYEGPSSSGTGHVHHDRAVFDYPGFHTTYIAVTQLCAARATKGSTLADLVPEKMIATHLWEALRTATPE